MKQFNPEIEEALQALHFVMQYIVEYSKQPLANPFSAGARQNWKLDSNNRFAEYECQRYPKASRDVLH